MAAGERPRSMRSNAAATQSRGIGGALRTVVSLILVAVIAGAVTGFVVLPSFRDTITSAIDQLRMAVAPSYVVVGTSGTASGAAIAGHPAAAAFDGFSNTWWAAPAGRKLPTIVAHFSPPSDVAKVLVTSGDAADYQSQPRPRSVKFEFLDVAGAIVNTVTAELQDTAGPQTVNVDAHGAASVRITVETVYASVGGASVSITEVEFRARH